MYPIYFLSARQTVNSGYSYTVSTYIPCYESALPAFFSADGCE